MARAKKTTKNRKTIAGVSTEDMDAVLKFLPQFEKPRFSFGRWEGGGNASEEAMSEPLFVLSKAAHRFYEHNWIKVFDWPKWQKQAIRYYKMPSRLKKAGIGTLSKLLTLHVRKERFCEGHLVAVHKSGHLVAILRRLQAIRKRIR